MVDADANLGNEHRSRATFRNLLMMKTLKLRAMRNLQSSFTACRGTQNYFSRLAKLRPKFKLEMGVIGFETEYLRRHLSLAQF